MAETYLQAHGASWKHRYAKAGWWNPLAKFAFPIIGELSLDEIEISHITAVMLRAEKAGVPDTSDGSDRASNWCSTPRSPKACARRR
jgi:hypothetical protein